MNPLEYISKLATQTTIKVIPTHKNENDQMVPKAMTKTTKLNLDTFKSLLKYQEGLNEGLSTFRKQVTLPKPPKKNHVKYRAKGHLVDYYYVDLGTLVSAINKGLRGSGKKDSKDTGLSFTQNTKRLNDLEVVVYTILRCDNGWQNTVAPVYVKTSSLYPQDVGGALTYAKRYSLSTAFGVPSQTDDDYRPDRHPVQKGQQYNQPNQVSNQNSNWTSKAQWRARQAKQPASKAQINAIDKMVREWTKVNSTVTVAKADNYLANNFNFGQSMTKPQASSAITAVHGFIADDKDKEKAAKEANKVKQLKKNK